MNTLFLPLLFICKKKKKKTGLEGPVCRIEGDLLTDMKIRISLLYLQIALAKGRVR